MLCISIIVRGHHQQDIMLESAGQCDILQVLCVLVQSASVAEACLACVEGCLACTMRQP